MNALVGTVNLEWLKEYPVLTFILGSGFSVAIGWKAVKELLSTYREQVKELRTERDSYRNDLHSARRDLQTKTNHIAELELQPNLGTLKTLIEGQTLAMTGIGDSGSAMAESLKEHMGADHKAFEAINSNMEASNETLKTISTGLSNLFKMLRSHDSRVAARVRKAKV